MAQFTKTNGTTQPVFALDVANGSVSLEQQTLRPKAQ
jgi:hypothetical protein